MTSALSSLLNATASLQVAGAGVYTDPATGNVIAVETTVELQLFLRAEKVAYTAYSGVNVVDTVYDGFAINPQVVPAGVGAGTVGMLRFAGEAETACEVLELRLPYGSVGVIGATMQGVLGDRIRLLARGQR